MGGVRGGEIPLLEYWRPLVAYAPWDDPLSHPERSEGSPPFILG